MHRFSGLVLIAAVSAMVGCATSTGSAEHSEAKAVAPVETVESKEAPAVLSQETTPKERCEAACERNGESCDVLDVPGCIKRCAAFESVGLCQDVVSEFFDCVEKGELACKEGDKLRPEGCRKHTYLASGCIMQQTQMAAEENTECAELCKTEGRCKLEGKMCVATSEEDCANSSYCKEAGWCTFVVNYCTNVFE